MKPVNPQDRKPWLDASLPEEKRVEALLAVMTVEEKRRQLSAYMFFDTYWQKQSTTDEAERIRFIESVTPEQMVPADGLGFVSTQLRDLPAGLAARTANRLQSCIIESTRLGIPPLIHDEGLHGLIGNGATSFPQALGMAASWNPALLRLVGEAIGREARTRGIRQLLSPTVNLARDPRAGRTEESYGEDPVLTSAFATAYIRGVQSRGVVCTPKHFAANFAGAGGRDSFAIAFSEREMREVYFPAFRASVAEAGAMSLMAAYNSVDGRPCSANAFLLQDVLRGEWGFDGFVVSDYHSLVHMYELHRTAATKEDAAVQALASGLDVELPRFDCFGEPLEAALAEGRVEEPLLDDAVRRVLRIKFRIGVFDSLLVSEEEAAATSNCEEHRTLALQMARESLVLLRNENGTLPLPETLRSVAVIGPNADAVRLGDYSWDLYGKDHVVTVLEGIRELVGERTEVHHAEGCTLAGEDRGGIAEAAALAGRCDAAVLVLGNSHELTGEARDRADLALPGVQTELARAVAAAGKPTAVVLVTGSVHTMEGWGGEVGAILQAWYPGEQGGHAVAEALFGRTNPGGRLPLTWPRHTGQCPITHNPKPSGRGYDHADLPKGPLFPFGHGLSYTEFHYADLHVREEESGRIAVRFEVGNRGQRAGCEVVQVYIRWPVCRVTTPLKRLAAFRRVNIPAGETVEVRFRLDPEDFAVLDERLRPFVPAGEYELLVGASSEDIRLRDTFRAG